MGSTIVCLGYSVACNIAHQHLTGSNSSLPLHQSAYGSNPRKGPFSKPRSSSRMPGKVQHIIVLCGIVQTGILATNYKIQKLKVLHKRSSNKCLLDDFRIVSSIHLYFILKSINKKCHRFENILFLSLEKD